MPEDEGRPSRAWSVVAVDLSQLAVLRRLLTEGDHWGKDEPPPVPHELPPPAATEGVHPAERIKQRGGGRLTGLAADDGVGSRQAQHVGDGHVDRRPGTLNRRPWRVMDAVLPELRPCGGAVRTVGLGR